MHIVKGEVTSSDMTAGSTLTTLGGATIDVGAGPTVAGNTLKKTDIKVSNGLLHAVNAVIMP